MRITLDDWIKLQKTLNKQQDTVSSGEIATGIPRAVHIGVLDRDGMVEIRMRLITEPEWMEFQNIWKIISGTNNGEDSLSHQTPQFFLSCE